MGFDPRYFTAAMENMGHIEGELEFDFDAAIATKSLARVYELSPRLALLDKASLDVKISLLRKTFGQDFKLKEFNADIIYQRALLRSQQANSNVGNLAWRNGLIPTKEGTPRPVLANAIIALRQSPEWAGVLAYNEFSHQVMKRKSPPWAGGAAGRWTDADCVLAADWLQHQGIFVSPDLVANAVRGVSLDNSFHPIREYLNGLKWDGQLRATGWLSTYLGSEQSAYTDAIGVKWLVSAVARIMQPGCQADHCLVLEGTQGIRKSSALRALAGDDWFADQISDLHAKDSSQDIQGKWILEFSDLSSMSRAESGVLKSFLTRRVDHFRESYGRFSADYPRQCVFAATTNLSVYFNDETGARRFWPTVCGLIDLPGLLRDRDQLWAEAKVKFDNKKTWWLDDEELVAIAREQQQDRYDRDPWDEKVWSYVTRAEEQWAKASDDNREFSITSEDLLEHAIKKHTENWTSFDKSRISRILRAHGLERFQLRKFSEMEGTPILAPDGTQEREYRWRRPRPVAKNEA